MAGGGRTAAADWLDGHLDRLCSAELGGRFVGTRGELAARDYLTDALASVGFAPAPGHAIPFRVAVPQIGVTRLVIDGIELEAHVDFSLNVQGAVGAGHVVGRCIWVGPGLPDSTTAGAIAVAVLSDGGSQAAALEEYLHKVRAARDAGARGILVVRAAPRRRKVMIHRHEPSPLPCLDVGRAAVALLFGTSEPTLGTRGAEVTIDVTWDIHEVTSAGNVVMDCGVGDVEAVLVAHYDHVGQTADGRHFPGAQDNASGVTVVLEAARLLRREWRRGRLVVLLTTAEELGSEGARTYVASQARGLGPDVLVVNVDEIAGGRECPVYCLGTRAVIPELLEPTLPKVGYPVRAAELPPGGYADHVAFVPHVARVVLLSSPSSQTLVHTLDDTPERLDRAKLRAAAALTAELVRRAQAARKATGAGAP